MNTVIHIKTDKVIKEKAQKMAEKIGLSLSAVINVQLRQFIKDKELYASEEGRPLSKKFERELRKIDVDIKAGRNMSKPLSTRKELVDYLESL